MTPQLSLFHAQHEKLLEVEFFHPLVARWLIANGYKYEHEVKLPDYGRADFIATHITDGHILAIECKPNSSINGAIMQAITYAIQVPDSNPAIAVVTSKMTKDNWRVAMKYNVKVITIEYSEAEYKSALLVGVKKNTQRIIKGYIRQALINPHLTAQEYLLDYFSDTRLASRIPEICESLVNDGYSERQVVEAVSQWLEILAIEDITGKSLLEGGAK